MRRKIYNTEKRAKIASQHPNNSQHPTQTIAFFFDHWKQDVGDSVPVQKKGSTYPAKFSDMSLIRLMADMRKEPHSDSDTLLVRF